MTASGRLVAGRYRLREQIGLGGMGMVWLALDERLHRDVAVKQVLPPAAADPEAARQQGLRTLREGRIAARLSHPHAISVFDVALEDGQPWLVMEYLPSRSLAAVLAEDGVLRVDQVAQIGAQVADALAATHAAGIVHRDVKPSNVLIGRGERIDGLVKITDFGISHASGDVTLTQTGQITGTPAFLAPEVAQGIEPGPAADVFALGATLYACLEGQPPFGRVENALQQLHRAAAGTIDPPQRSGTLTQTLVRMLAADPAARPDMVQVRDELAAVAAGRGGDASAVLLAPTDLTPQVPSKAGASPRGADAGPPTRAMEVPDPASTTDSPLEPVVAPVSSEPLHPEDGQPRRRRTAPVAVAAAVLVAVLAGAILWSLVRDPAPDADVASSAAPTTTSMVSTSTSTSPGPPPTVAAAAPPIVADTTEPSAGPDETTGPRPTTSTTADEPDPDGGPILADSIEGYLEEYHALVVDDPAAAYAAAGPTLRSSISLSGFEQFWGRFASVSISNVRPSESGDRALAVVTFGYPDGTRQVEEHRFEFVEEVGRLVLDRDAFVEVVSSRA